ncbi:MAG: hypothetical protein H8E66_13560 [Planctomycetes bacterium]|nr:hypothetical protein [Planctomycetota bacterium]
MATEFARVANAPVLDCLVSETVWDEGIGNVLLSRELRNGQVACAVSFVDIYCLGVKDVIADIRSKMSYREELLQRLLDRSEYDEVAASYVRKLVESAVAYAHSFGLPPTAFIPDDAIYMEDDEDDFDDTDENTVIGHVV